MSVFKNFTQIDIASASTEFQCLQECPEDISETNQKEPGRTFSEFNEGSCGEPQMAQHLVVDFTHNNLDSEFVQKKCCAFWELIKSHPEIQNLMVIPEAGMYATPSSTDIATEDVFTEKTEEEPTIKEHTAVSMLDIVSKKGFIDKSFVAKIPQTFCPLGSTEYLENEAIKKPKAAQKKTKDPGLCHCPRERECCSKPKAEDIAPRSSKTVRAMCENMDKWDQQHPKSMEPPGHALPLIHCVMQRKHN